MTGILTLGVKAGLVHMELDHLDGVRQGSGEMPGSIGFDQRDEYVEPVASGLDRLTWFSARLRPRPQTPDPDPDPDPSNPVLQLVPTHLTLHLI